MWEVILDALLDSLILLPVLLAVHILIEFIEHRTGGIAPRLLNGKLSPLIGTAAGILPQCGFSVAATKLYSKKHIPLGTLLAVYIATSDEAIPILLSDLNSAKKLLPLLAVKIVAALAVGYAVNLFMNRFKGRDKSLTANKNAHDRQEDIQADCHGHCRAHCESEKELNDELIADCSKAETCFEADKTDNDKPITGCHGHEIGGHGHKRGSVFKRYFVHPLKHTAVVFAFILLINLVLGFIIYFVGESALEDFMQSVGIFQPLFAAIIGLIPNCAASVAVTRMYAAGYLGLGATVAGLTASAGLGYAVLIKDNKNRRHSVIIILSMFAFSVVLGTAVYLIFG